MLYYICRTILHSSPTYKLPYHLRRCKSKFLSVRFSSASAEANQQSFVVSYLVNSCGLSLESALSASKYVNFKTPENADAVLGVFREQGFSESQISVLVRALPRLLSCNPEKTLLPKFEFFNSKGFKSSEVVQILCKQPSILKRSLEKRIIPSYNLCKDLINFNERVVRAIKLTPRILMLDPNVYLLRNFDILRRNGVRESCIVELLSCYSGTLMTKSDKFNEIVERVKNLGFDPSKMRFCLAVHLFKSMSKTTWEKKVSAFKKWGWSDEDILQAFRKTPLCMMTSKEKIAKMLHFLVNKMGCDPCMVPKHPYILSYSLEKRFIPRAAVIQALSSKGIRQNASLVTLFSYSEKTFLQKCVNCHDEAAELMKLYKRKKLIVS